MSEKQAADLLALLGRIADALEGHNAAPSEQAAAALATLQTVADERDKALVRATRAENELAAARAARLTIPDEG